MPGMPSEAELQRANAGPGIMKTARFAYDARAPDEHRWRVLLPPLSLPLRVQKDGGPCAPATPALLRRMLVEICESSQHQHSSSVVVEDKIESDDARLIPVSKREQ
jgi:hypothetical protein